MRPATPVGKMIAMSTNDYRDEDPKDLDDLDAPPPKKRSGCWFWGCAISAVLAVILGIGGYFLVTNLLGMFTDMMVDYSETEPMPIKPSTMSLDDYDALTTRIEVFDKASKADEQPDPLVLSSQDINALIANHPGWLVLRNRAHVELEGDRIKAEVSFPLDYFAELPMIDVERLKGRFLNATGEVSLSLRDGEISLRVHELDFHGKQLPVAFMASLRDGNALKNNQNHPEIDKVRERTNTFWIEDGLLKIEARKPR
ncbi:MAG: hypothetical protein ACI8UD_004056 [Planctomycetota bacterium]|jgi:hypothetical protein